MTVLPRTKSISLLLAAAMSTTLVQAAQAEQANQADDPLASIQASNPSTFARPDEIIDLDLAELGLAPDATADLVARIGGEPIPLQVWDRDGDGTLDRLSVQLDLEPAARADIEIRREPGVNPNFPRRVQAEVSHKVGGEWNERVYEGGEWKQQVAELTPPPQHTDHSFFIRYEGPGWESDKVGYRFYLDWRNGFDIFGKLTPEPVLQQVGLDGFDSYHEPADWGLDILKVGDAVGCGGFGYWNGEAVERVSEVEGWTTRITANGPIYAQIVTDYKGWKVAGKQVDLRAVLRIGAGSRMTWVTLVPSEPVAPLAAGLVKHPGGTKLDGPGDVPMVTWNYLATYGTQTLSDDDLGMAIFLRDNHLDKFTEDPLNEVALFSKDLREVNYGFLAAWEQEPGGIADRAAFEAHLEQLREKLNRPARLRVETAATAALRDTPLDGDRVRDITVRTVESILARRGSSLAHGHYDPEAERPAKWCYTTGLLAQAVHEAGKAFDREEFRRFGAETIASYVTPQGEVKTYKQEDYNVDQLNSGKMLLRLHDETKEERYQVAAAHLHQQFEKHPKTSEGALWHKQVYPWQVWLDGVYMAGPFQAGYLARFEDKPDWDEVLQEFRTCYEHLRDPRSGLYFHAWDEKREQDWADDGTGLSQEFWGRGLGWYAMALVDVLESIPESHEGHPELQNHLAELATALVAVQNPVDGMWYQVLDKPGAVGNYPESSASSMFVYTLAKGVNRGWLDERFGAAAKRGFRGLVDICLRSGPQGELSLQQTCRVAGLGRGRDGSYDYYMNEPIVANDPKGIGPFVLAGVELSRLLGDS